MTCVSKYTSQCDLFTKRFLVTQKPTILRAIHNSYIMGCLPVRGDNPRALASGLSYVQVDKHGITILYHIHQCSPCTLGSSINLLV